jgi:hypothetical protein
MTRDDQIRSLRLRHRPERTWWGRRTGWCRCGERIGGETCWILAQSLASYGAI